MNTWFNERQGV